MFEVKEIGRSVSVAIAAVLLGSTLVLSAVGPARATTDAPMLASEHPAPATLRYLA